MAMGNFGEGLNTGKQAATDLHKLLTEKRMDNIINILKLQYDHPDIKIIDAEEEAKLLQAMKLHINRINVK